MLAKAGNDRRRDLLMGLSSLMRWQVSRGLGRMMADAIGSGNTIDVLSEELAERWVAQFRLGDWRGRLDLLQQIHDQLKEDINDMDLYCAISPLLVRKLIERLAPEPVGSAAQAQIYANSASDEHRRVAGQWLREHRAEKSRAGH
jgi:hypothetical protein